MRVLVIGGARSGKSRIAEELALKVAENESLPLVYLATSQGFDEEMRERIAHHRETRSNRFQTVEEPLEVAGWLEEQPQQSVVLIECLSLLLSNWMLHGLDVEGKMDDLYRILQETTNPWVVVSNEVGMGIVPGDPLSRLYRDHLGRMHQYIAQMADHVYLTIAGIPLDIKASQSSFHL